LELVKKSKKKRFFAVCHRFDELYGSKHNNGDFVESTYQIIDGPGNNGDLVVSMQVKGNYTGYQHSPCFWLNDTSYYYGGYGMAWNGYPLGDSWIIEFALIPAHLPKLVNDSVASMPLVTSLARADYYGSVTGVLNLGDESKFKPMLEVLRLKDTKFKSFGPFLWMRDSAKVRTVLLPKDVIKIVALKMVGVPRDKAGLKLCINTMRSLVSPAKMSIPADMRLQCATYGAALAFVYGLEDEIIAFNRVCKSKYIRMYEHLGQAMSLKRFRCCLPFVSEPDWFVAAEEYNNTRTSMGGPTFDATKAWPEGLPGVECTRELVPRKKKSTMSKGTTEKIEDKPQFYPVCVTFSNYIPVVPYASHNNETIAINNRALVETPRADKALWGRLGTHSKSLLDKFTPISGFDVEGDFKAWNARFEKGRQRNQANAFEDLKKNPLTTEDFKRKSFVKRELTMKGGEEFEEFDPRAIQGNSDRLNAALGPFIYKFSKQLANVWNSDKDICYTSGMTAEQIGSWRGQFGAEDVTIIEIDESRYDTHQGEECYDFRNMFYKHCGIDHYGQAGFASTSMSKIFGYTSKGVKYSVPFTMSSGSPDTSCANSLINGIKTEYAVKSFGLKGFKMLVHGDDNLLVVRGQLSQDEQKALRNHIIDFNHRLGFKSKVTISTQWEHVEYCSSLFWPTHDGFVLGPKIGKRLPKIGFSLNKLELGEVKGMLLGLQIEAGYVPLIGSYAKHCLKFLSKTQKKDFIDKRSIYKSLAKSKHVLCDDTKLFFLERYGVAYDDCLSEFLSCLKGTVLGSCVEYRYLPIFIAKDL
jgi:hypothetical protein